VVYLAVNPYFTWEFTVPSSKSVRNE